jgi:hypothetical protein
MRFDRSLGNVQIASDFRVVASLEKQLDNLPVPGIHLYEIVFHKSTHLTDAPRSRQVAPKATSRAASGFGSLRLTLHSRGQIALRLLTARKNSGLCVLLLEKRLLRRSWQAAFGRGH